MPGGGDQVLVSIHEVAEDLAGGGVRRRWSRPHLARCARARDRGLRARHRHGRGRRRDGQARGRELGGTSVTPLCDAAPAGRRDAAAMHETTVGLTGSWDSRISRRTLLRTGGAAAVLLYGSAVPSASARPALRERPVHARRRLGRADPRRDRAVDAPRARSAQRRRPRRGDLPRPLRDRQGSELPQHRAPRPHASRARGGSHGPRRGHGPPAGARLLVPLRVEAGRSSPVGRFRTGAAVRHGARAPEVRLRLVPELHLRLLLGASTTSRSSPTSSSWCTSATTSTRGRAWSAARGRTRRPAPLMTLADYRTRHAQYKTDLSLQEVHRSVPVGPDLGRPRVLEQLRRPRPRQRPSNRSRRSPQRRPRRTSPTGSTARSRARASRSARTCRCTGAAPGATSCSSTCSTRASTAPTRSARARSRSGRAATARPRSTPRATSSAPSSAPG